MSQTTLPPTFVENQTLPPSPAGRRPRTLVEQLGDVAGLPRRFTPPKGPSR